MLNEKAKEIAALLGPAINDLGLELYGVEFAPSTARSLLRLYIDVADRPVTLEDCEQVSREVSALLDVNDPIQANYTLEVSSPGIDRPLFTAEQFARYLGETAKVQLSSPQDGRRRAQGVIRSVENQRITLDVPDFGEFAFEFGNLDKAKLIPDYEKLGLASQKKGSKGKSKK